MRHVELGQRGHDTAMILFAAMSPAAIRPLPAILIITADEGVRNAIRLLLRVEGYAAECLATGEDAIRIRDLAPRFLLIADQDLADGDGLALMTVLRKRYPGMSGILMASPPAARVSARTLDPAIALIEKPLVAERLVQAVHDWAARAILH